MENVKEELVEIKQRAASNSHRIDNHDDEIKEIREEIKTLYTLNTEIKLLTQTVAGMAEKLEDVRVSTGSLARDIAEVKSEPHRNKALVADKILWIISSAIILGIMTFLLKAVAPNVF